MDRRISDSLVLVEISIPESSICVQVTASGPWINYHGFKYGLLNSSSVSSQHLGLKIYQVRCLGIFEPIPCVLIRSTIELSYSLKSASGNFDIVRSLKYRELLHLVRSRYINVLK